MEKEDFYSYQAQTTAHPLGLEVSHAKGAYIYDTSGKAYLDFVAGVSACTLGHCHPRIGEAIREQSGKYLHVMVYGEYIQAPAVAYTKLLSEQLPNPLQTTYLVNSGTEAMEGAIKLARRVTGRSKLIAAHGAYHGNTLGSLSLMDCEERKAPFRPLLPGVAFIPFNDKKTLEQIDRHTAAVILETIQGGAGFITPEAGYLQAVRERCDETGALLILDEIQPGFGRTGRMFAFEHYQCIPDILVIGKGMASGLPVGAFVASKEHMKCLSHDPALGHITTFGGNALIAAAAKATLEELLHSDLIAQVEPKELLFRSLLRHELIREVRGKGLMLCAIFPSAEIAREVVLQCAQSGLILFWLLFENKAVRITPPLTISEEEIAKGCAIMRKVLDRIGQ